MHSHQARSGASVSEGGLARWRRTGELVLIGGGDPAAPAATANLIDRLRTNRQALFTEADAIRAAADTEERDLTEAELARVRQIRTDADTITARIEEEQEAEVRRLAAANSDQTPPGQRSTVVVTSEPRTYTPETARRGVQFIRDVVQGTIGNDFQARDRLARHMQEARVEGELVENRDVGTGAFAGLTVPQYLTDLVANVARAGRPFANICRHLDLPSAGMSVNISRITTGAAVATQATENTAVQETNMDDTLLTVPVVTIAGMQDVSLQAIQRGEGVDEVVLQDLVGAYNAELDRQLIHADGTGGTHLGVLATPGNIDVTYTDASPTAAELYPKLADAISQIQAAIYEGVSHFVMHPRRWFWLASQVGTTFPFLNMGQTTVQAGNVGGTDYLSTQRHILGVPVVLDGNISITQGAGAEDSLLAVVASECFLWEERGAPLMIRADQALSNQLSARMVVYGFSAFTAGRRPAATANILGTGMTTPTF